MKPSQPTPNEALEATASQRFDRRQSLMQATFDIIAAEGFEGLRTRAVADRAGVNIATLHYYYPTKEALIAAFALYLGGIFANTHAPPVPSTGRDGLDRLRQEFADAAFYLAEHKDLMTVMGEMGLRSQRDPVVKQHLEMMLFYWRRSVAETVKAGLEDGSFRPELDPDPVTNTLVAILGGIAVLGQEGIESVRQAVEQWLVCPEKEREQSVEPTTT
ncbi:MAG TPA: TetR/AcrR family transcriptional regulator [Chthonomonadaceae bacterium]|nr:TetR/AcrR family transcriptional regulator [Chthonomonadaceae bacterium]